MYPKKLHLTLVDGTEHTILVQEDKTLFELCKDLNRDGFVIHTKGQQAAYYFPAGIVKAVPEY